jgi:hypothetical protein
MLAAILAALACGIVACGDDDHAKSASAPSQADTGTSTGGQSRGARTHRDRRRGGQSGDSGGARNDATADAPRRGSRTRHPARAPRRKSLLRYLAANYRKSPWYPLLSRLRISGGYVRVYLTFSPESDDEAPPVLACSAVLSYGKRVKKVTVYGSPTSQGRTSLLKEC